MLHDCFFDTACRRPNDPALVVEDCHWTYAELLDRAELIAQRLRLEAPASKRCLLFGYRSADTYAGLLGILRAGTTYVPLNPKFPPARNAAIIQRSGADVMLIDQHCQSAWEGVQPLLETPLKVIQLNTAQGLQGSKRTELPSHGPEHELAYILFTSGTTGQPKGVQISHASACAYVRSISTLFPVTRPIRHTQMFDLTFDLSVHDMFVCWANGGCLYVPSDKGLLQPGAFIKQHAITHWFSVPSMASFMMQFKKLAPDAYPSIEMSMFCGEALPYSLAEAWWHATPNSRLVNLYGPTEATVAFTYFEFELSNTLSNISAVPIGCSLPEQETVVINEHLEQLPPGQTGELVLGGSQLSDGYISSNEADHLKFFHRSYAEKKSGRWYRTGDLVSDSDSFGLLFRGRVDSQIKLRGYRIELQEVEHVVSLASASICAVVPWPLDNNGSPLGLVAFLQKKHDLKQDEEILQACRAQLPEYACPEMVIHLEKFPLNSNGKIDRAQLRLICSSAIQNL